MHVLSFLGDSRRQDYLFLSYVLRYPCCMVAHRLLQMNQPLLQVLAAYLSSGLNAEQSLRFRLLPLEEFVNIGELSSL